MSYPQVDRSITATSSYVLRRMGLPGESSLKKGECLLMTVYLHLESLRQALTSTSVLVNRNGIDMLLDFPVHLLLLLIQSAIRFLFPGRH
jgi:hypothetical protein